MAMLLEQGINSRVVWSISGTIHLLVYSMQGTQSCIITDTIQVATLNHPCLLDQTGDRDREKLFTAASMYGLVIVMGLHMLLRYEGHHARDKLRCMIVAVEPAML